MNSPFKVPKQRSGDCSGTKAGRKRKRSARMCLIVKQTLWPHPWQTLTMITLPTLLPFKPPGQCPGEGPAVPPGVCPGPSARSGMSTQASPTARPGASLWPQTRELWTRVWKDSLFNTLQVVVKLQMRVVPAWRKIRKKVYCLTDLYHILVWMTPTLPLQTLHPLQPFTLVPSSKEPVMVEKETKVTPNLDDLVFNFIPSGVLAQFLCCPVF